LIEEGQPPLTTRGAQELCWFVDAEPRTPRRSRVVLNRFRGDRSGPQRLAVVLLGRGLEGDRLDRDIVSGAGTGLSGGELGPERAILGQ
jgi:hypothetical protein